MYDDLLMLIIHSVSLVVEFSIVDAGGAWKVLHRRQSELARTQYLVFEHSGSATSGSHVYESSKSVFDKKSFYKPSSMLKLEMS